MDRIEQLEQSVGKYIFERFSQNKEKIVSSYRANKEEIWKEFFDIMCCGAEECEKKNKNVKHIIISILYSSILTQSYELQIAYMNDDLHVDEAPVNVYWAPMFIFQFIEDDILFLKKKVSKDVPRIKEYEMDDIRKKYVLNHYFLVMLLLKESAGYNVGKLQGSLTEPKSGLGMGLCQWSFPARQQGLYDMASSMGLSWDTYEVQIAFIFSEIDNDNSFKDVRPEALNALQSIEEITRVFMTVYENPGIEHFDWRKEEAEHVHTEYTGGK